MSQPQFLVNLWASIRVYLLWFELLYGYVPSHDEGALREFFEQSEQYNPNHENRHVETIKTILDAQQKMKARYDSNRDLKSNFAVGDLVFFKVNPTATGDSTKLQYKNRGALVVTEVLPHDTYGITEINDQKRNRYCSTAHASQLKLWKPPSDSYDEGNLEDDEGPDSPLRRPK
ncbi:hypothetical protein TKK_0003181 [Trichogramma kaykai]